MTKTYNLVMSVVEEILSSQRNLAITEGQFAFDEVDMGTDGEDDK